MKDSKEILQELFTRVKKAVRSTKYGYIFEEDEEAEFDPRVEEEVNQVRLSLAKPSDIGTVVFDASAEVVPSINTVFVGALAIVAPEGDGYKDIFAAIVREFHPNGTQHSKQFVETPEGQDRIVSVTIELDYTQYSGAWEVMGTVAS